MLRNEKSLLDLMTWFKNNTGVRWLCCFARVYGVSTSIKKYGYQNIIDHIQIVETQNIAKLTNRDRNRIN